MKPQREEGKEGKKTRTRPNAYLLPDKFIVSLK